MRENLRAPIEFGFLPFKWEIHFRQGRVVPTLEFDRALKYVDRNTNKDGFIYPPIVKTVSIGIDGATGRTEPKTKRPAHLYRLPPSHELHLDMKELSDRPFEGTAAFVIHYLAFLFRTRLQFSHWYFDGRIPIRNNAQVSTSSGASEELSSAFEIWSTWPELERQRFVNILYMFSRTSSYEWDWEEFTVQYMVLDACWKMAENLFGLKAKSHPDRVNVLCEKFSLSQFQNKVSPKELAKLRNELFHEVLWAGGRPGSAAKRGLYHVPTVMENFLVGPLIVGIIKMSAKKNTEI